MNTQTFAVPADGTTVTRYVGSYSYVLFRTTNGPVQFSFDNNTWQTASINDKYGPLKVPATRFYLRAVNGQANNVTVVFSTTPIEVHPGSFQVPATYTKGTDLKGGTQIGIGQTVTFSGQDGVNMRKQITVQNLDNNNNPIEVQDGNGKTMAVLFANQPPWTVETSGTIKIYNPSVAAILRVSVGEIFYA